jgi:phosphatidylglycerol---prolipoprotein diacylglyceryl transferase
MPQILHDIDPYLIRLYGEFGIRWYSLAYLLGFVLVRWYLIRAARAGELRNVDEAGVDSWVGWCMLGAILGARFFHVFVFEFERYHNRPEAWLAVWRGGLSFHGGLTGVALATWIFCRSRGADFYQLADRAVIPVAIALGFGRIANFINGEMYGTLYNGPFCIDYSGSTHLREPPQGCRHPVQFYQVVKNWSLAGALWLMLRRWRPPSGVVFWAFVGLYGFARFFLMYLRDEARIWAGLTQSQIFSGIMAVVGAVFVVYQLLSRRDSERQGRRMLESSGV